ncbi:MAG TPA: DUF5662 family protein [Rickettsiales bacterium]|nr:DUF5662 family protein [Rickettsiales bacterium]
MLREEKLNHYIERTLRHSHDVANLLFTITKHLDELSFKVDKYNLLKRAVSHDTDKFYEEFIEAIVDCFYLQDQTTKERLEEAEKIVDRHYVSNSHHVEYHINNNIPLSNEDICEMACDWISSHRKDNPELVESASNMKNKFDDQSEKNIKRYLFFKDYKEKFFELYDLLEKLHIINK